MKIEELYTQNETITLNNYLEDKCKIQDVEEYLSPTGKYIENWTKYPNINEALKEIQYESLQKDSKIFLIQDCDVDGICSCVIIYQALKTIRPNWNIKVLLHTSKQRGLDDEDIMARIKKEKPTLVIVTDAGTNNAIQAKVLTEMGIGLIVIDHHDFGQSVIQDGYLINNQDPDFKGQRQGSGALVTHKFVQGMDNFFNTNIYPTQIDLVALSLVSDSMDMSSMENREYYYYGLSTKDCIYNPFLKKVFDTYIPTDNYTQRDVAFKIVPKFNAICRCQNQEIKQKLFLAFIGKIDVYEILQLCEEAHTNQIETINTILNEATPVLEELNKNSNFIFYASDIIPRSYSGLVCGKVKSLCDNKPCIVGSIKNGYFIGSVRSPIPLRTELSNNELVDFAEGHEMSFGIGVEEKNIPALIEQYKAIDYSASTTVLRSYSVFSISDRVFTLFEGKDDIWTDKGVPYPNFHIKLTFSPDEWDIIGNNKRTLKLSLENCNIMLFNATKQDKIDLGLGYYENDVFVHDPKLSKYDMEIIGTLSKNRYTAKNGNTYITNQIIVNRYEVKVHKVQTHFSTLF